MRILAKDTHPCRSRNRGLAGCAPELRSNLSEQPWDGKLTHKPPECGYEVEYSARLTPEFRIRKRGSGRCPRRIQAISLRVVCITLVQNNGVLQKGI